MIAPATAVVPALPQERIALEAEGMRRMRDDLDALLAEIRSSASLADKVWACDRGRNEG
jgi:hypothetical protein